MSAPEPRVRVEPSLTAGWHYWVCDACGFRSMASPDQLDDARATLSLYGDPAVLLGEETGHE